MGLQLWPGEGRLREEGSFSPRRRRLRGAGEQRGPAALQGKERQEQRAGTNGDPT